MPPHPLLKLGSVVLNPPPHRRVISAQTTLDQQLFNVTEREGISKIPTNRAKNDLGLALPPFEDRWAFRHRNSLHPISPNA
jgi:hypothetical protein